MPEIARFMLEQTRRIDLANSCWDTLVALGLTEARELFEEYLWEEFGRLYTRFSEGRDERLTTIVALLLSHAKPGTWTALRDLIFRNRRLLRRRLVAPGTYPKELTGWDKWDMAKLLSYISG
jgi:hypothetical protein